VDTSKGVTQCKAPVEKNNGAFTLDVKSVLNENLGGILGGGHPMWNGR